MMRLTFDQIARILRIKRSWETTPSPYGIPHFHPFNPCLPEQFDSRLECVTCGMKQKLELTNRMKQYLT